MENGVIDYLSFVRGFIAATNPDTRDRGTQPERGVDPGSYAEGFVAGSGPVEHSADYRELSIQDGGRFTGMLDLPPTQNGRDEVPKLFGVLDLG